MGRSDSPFCVGSVNTQNGIHHCLICFDALLQHLLIKVGCFWFSPLIKNIEKTFEPHLEKTCLMPYANKKGADKPAHPCSLISTFVVCCQDNIIPIVAKAKISRLYVAE